MKKMIKIILIFLLLTYTYDKFNHRIYTHPVYKHVDYYSSQWPINNADFMLLSGSAHTVMSSQNVYYNTERPEYYSQSQIIYIQTNL